MEQSRPIGAGRVVAITAAVLLGAMGVSAGGLDLLARNHWLESCAERAHERYCRVRNVTFGNRGYFIDIDDRFLYEELPAVDYSRGGVYFFGSSALRASTEFWKLPPEQRVLIHDFSISHSSFDQKFRFLRYLVEQEGMLRAGGEKNQVIFGVGYAEIFFGYERNDFFTALWGRHGIYQYSANEGITPVAVNPLWRFSHFERMRIAGCFGAVAESVEEQCQIWRGVPPARRDDLVQSADELAQRRMSMDWQARMREQLQQLDGMIGYLQDRGVHVGVVMLPVGSWEANWPFARTFRGGLSEICAAKRISFYDWSGKLADSDIADCFGHDAIAGTDKASPALVGLALPFLRSTGALR